MRWHGKEGQMNRAVAPSKVPACWLMGGTGGLGELSRFVETYCWKRFVKHDCWMRRMTDGFRHNFVGCKSVGVIMASKH